MKNYYEILGLSANATAHQIKKRHRKLAMQFHPDKNPNDKTAEEKFKIIQEAYEVLGDAVSRKKFDSAWQAFKEASAKKNYAQENASTSFTSGKDIFIISWQNFLAVILIIIAIVFIVPRLITAKNEN